MSDKRKLLENIKLFVLDMDGTFYLGDNLIEGSLEFLDKVKASGRRFMFFTNNSSRTPQDYIEKLARMNCPITQKDIMTSGDITIEYLKTNYPGKTVYLMGTQTLCRSFKNAGINLINEDNSGPANADSSAGNFLFNTQAGAVAKADAFSKVKTSAAEKTSCFQDGADADITPEIYSGATRAESLSGVQTGAVVETPYDNQVDAAEQPSCVQAGAAAIPDVAVAAFDKELTYDKLTKICDYVRGGSVFLATHPDINCPTETGFIPDCGAFCAAITLSTGKEPKYLGKPYKETVDMITTVTGLKREEIAFVGDRLYTDIAVGVNNGATGLLVLSGETKPEDIPASPVQPDATFQNLAEIGTYL